MDLAHPPPADDTRQQAERRLAALSPARRIPQLGPEQMSDLLHELTVHQVELEIQNEQLRHTQSALEASRDRYLRLFEDAPVGYVTLTMDGSIVEANRIACALLGTSPKDTLHRTFARSIVAADVAQYQQQQSALFRGDGPQY